MGLAVLAAKDTFVFISEFKNDTNLITSWVEKHSWNHNATYLKYGCNKTEY